MHTYICVIWLRGSEIKKNSKRVKERNITSVNDVQVKCVSLSCR